MTLKPGTRLGPYEILAPLGAGGMGEVYRARDPRLGREVAIKVLPEEVAADADRLRRFEKEARSASALNHPNILTIHDIGTDDNAPYVVSELLEGETLREAMEASTISVRKATDYAIQIAQGLAAAHESGVERALGSSGVWGAARVEGEVRNRRGPSARPLSGQGGSYKPKVKSSRAQRESEGTEVPEIATRKSRSNSPGGERSVEKVRELQRRLLERGMRRYYLQRWPSQRSMKRVRQRVKELTGRSRDPEAA